MAQLIMDDLLLSAEKSPAKTAVADSARQASYRELYAEALSVAMVIMK